MRSGPIIDGRPVRLFLSHRSRRDTEKERLEAICDLLKPKGIEVIYLAVEPPRLPLRRRHEPRPPTAIAVWRAADELHPRVVAGIVDHVRRGVDEALDDPRELRW